MTKAGAKLIEAAAEAVAVARGEQPAGRIHVNGFAYVPVDRWEPIDTAPKDGALVLLCMTPYRGYLSAPMKVGYWNVREGGWELFGGSWKPTHWMPLPSPPVQGGE